MLDLCGQQSRSAEQRSGELLDEGVDMVDDKEDKEEEWEVVVVFGLERKGNRLLDDRSGWWPGWCGGREGGESQTS